MSSSSSGVSASSSGAATPTSARGSIPRGGIPSAGQPRGGTPASSSGFSRGSTSSAGPSHGGTPSTSTSGTSYTRGGAPPGPEHPLRVFYARGIGPEVQAIISRYGLGYLTHNDCENIVRSTASMWWVDEFKARLHVSDAVAEALKVAIETDLGIAPKTA